jgi:hypothetical protein
MITSVMIDNLTRAIALIEDTPENKLDLAHFTGDCGTLHCTAGWLATNPHFQKQGMGLVELRFGYGTNTLTNTLDEEHRLYDFQFLNELFGPEAFDRLFDAYGEGKEDLWLIKEKEGELSEDQEADIKEGDYKPTTDKWLALARLKRQLLLIELGALK